MARILITFGTREGHTAAVAERLAAGLREVGHEVEVQRVRRLGSGPTVEGRDVVVVGASVHVGHFERELVHWVRAHASDLQRLEATFFTVSLAAAGGDEGRKELAGELEQFVQRTGWKPARVGQFAGALAYTHYNWFLRRLMRRIAASHEETADMVDTSRDYYLTDWDAVDAFAREIAAALSGPGSTERRSA